MNSYTLRQRFGSRSSIFIGLLLLLSPTLWAAPHFTVHNAATELQGNVYFLNAVIEIELSEEQIMAIENGLAFPLQLDVEVLRQRDWWMDELVVRIEDQYRLKYLPLTELYQIEHVNSGMIRRVNSLEKALKLIGVIEHKSLLDRHALELEAHYAIRLRLRINREVLPVPLQSNTLLNADWNLVSDWFEWELQP